MTTARNTLLVLHTLSWRIRRTWRYKDASLYIPKGVFNPVLTFTAGMLIDSIRPEDESIADLYTGSGVIPIVLEKRGAYFSAGYDISHLAIAVARINARINRVKTFFTNNIDELNAKRPYTVVTANPPYLPCRAINVYDNNWCSPIPWKTLYDTVEKAGRLLERGGRLLFTLSTLSGISAELVNSVLTKNGFKNASIKKRPLTPFESILLVSAKKAFEITYDTTL